MQNLILILFYHLNELWQAIYNANGVTPSTKLKKFSYE